MSEKIKLGGFNADYTNQSIEKPSAYGKMTARKVEMQITPRSRCL
jgi:hypothetical protein